MTLSTDDRTELSKLVGESVQEAMRQYTPICPCNLDEESLKHVGHFFGMLRDIGEGDVGKGCERMRDVADAYKRGAWIAEKVGWAIIITIVAGTLGLLWGIIKVGMAVKTGIGG
jgi:uncharacterized protein CbrC (UPF0167 family)